MGLPRPFSFSHFEAVAAPPRIGGYGHKFPAEPDTGTKARCRYGARTLPIIAARSEQIAF